MPKVRFLDGASIEDSGLWLNPEEQKKNFFCLVLFLLYTSNDIVVLLLIAEEWKHETVCTVSQQ